MTDETVDCFNCGSANPEWAQVCRSCGVALRHGEARMVAAGRVPTDRDSLVSIGAVIGTILAALVIGLFISSLNPTDPTVGRETPSPSATPEPTLESSVPPGLEVHLVLDNLKTHKTRLIHDWLVKRPHFHLHFTPTSASWLNLVECWFALLSRRRLERGAFTSTDDLEAAIHAYIAATNAEPKPFVWTKTADDILASVARFCQRTSNSAH